MKDSGVHLPPRAGLQPERARMIENAVVTFVPVFQAADDIVFRRARLESKKCVWKIVLHDVVLRGKVIRLRFAFLADLPGELLALMHVMRNRSEIVEEFAEDVPSAFARHHIGSEQIISGSVHGVFQQEFLSIVEMHVTQAFIVASERSVRCLDG